jgi:hypothetical protein
MSNVCLFGEVTKVGTTVAGFLSIEPGARAVGLGGAYVAIAEGPISMFWNPAGIARQHKMGAVFNYSRWLLDVNYNFAGITIPMGQFGTIGANAVFLSMDDMQITTIDQPDGVENGYFSAGSYAIGVCYATNLTDRFSVGFNMKYIDEHIWNTKATGIAFDVGTLFTTQFDGLQIGMSISNYGTKMQMAGKDLLIQHDIDELQEGNNPNINANLATDKFDLPLIFRVGIAMDVLKGIGNSNLLLAIDALHPNNNAESINLGCEYVFNNMFCLRGGYNTLFLPDDENGLSFGAGVRYEIGTLEMVIDYAYRDFGILNDIQMFTLQLMF